MQKKKKHADRKPNVKPCEISVGDRVVIVWKLRRTKSSPFYDSKPYKVTQRKGNMISASREDHSVTKKITIPQEIASLLKSFIMMTILTSSNQLVLLIKTVNDETSDIDSCNDSVPVFRRSQHLRRPPQRLDDS